MDINELKILFSNGEIDKIKGIPTLIKDELLINILYEISNDKNSSSFREFVTLDILGLTQSKNKFGYDSDDSPSEVKPRNIRTNLTKKHDGGGNFSDFTWGRHKKYLEDNVKMFVSGFLDGKIVFILSFNYNETEFVKNIERQLTKHLPMGDKPSKYVKSVCFSYTSYKNSESPKLEYLSPKIDDYSKFFTNPFLKFLKNL
jgi:hypothetical protein